MKILPLNQFTFFAAMTSILLSATALPVSSRPLRGCHRGLPSRLGFTPEQQSQFDALKENRFNRIQSLLTADQQVVAREAKTARETSRELYCQIDLTDTQKQEIRTIRQENRQEFMSILSPEQQEQVSNWRSFRRERNSSNREF